MSETTELEVRLRAVFTQVLGLGGDVVWKEVSLETVPSWDSMAQINLILAVEQELRVSLTPEEASEAISYEMMRDLVETKRGV